MKWQASRRGGWKGWAVGLMSLPASLLALPEPGYEQFGPSFSVEPGQIPVAKLSQPYHPTSLRGRSNKEIFEWVTSRRSYKDYAEKEALRRLPPGVDIFAADSAESAALQLIERERGGDPAKRPKVVLPAKIELPASGWVEVQIHLSTCSQQVRYQYLMRWEPSRAWRIASAGIESPTVRGRDPYQNGARRFDLHVMDLDPADARRVAEVLHLVAGARFAASPAEPEAEDAPRYISTSSHHVFVDIGSDNGLLVSNLGGGLPTGRLTNPWLDGWTPEFAASLAERVILAQLYRRVFGEWEEPQPTSLDEAFQMRRENALKSARQILDRTLGSPGPVAELLAQAVAAVGEFRACGVEEELDWLEVTQPPVNAWELRRDELVGECQRGGQHAGDELWRHTAVRLSPSEDAERAAGHLREVLAVARRQVADGNDTARLAGWIEAREPGADWAFRRLLELHRTAALSVLEKEALREHDVEKCQRSSAFRMLERLAPANAKAVLARCQPAPAEEAPAVSAPAESSGSAEEEAPEPPKPAEKLAAVLEAAFEEAREKLASAPDPAARQAIPSLEAALSTPSAHSSSLLIWLAPWVPHASPAARERFRQAIEQRLRAGEESSSRLIEAAWVAGLRELHPLVAGLATSSPEDFDCGEDKPRADGGLRRMHRARHFASLWDEPDAMTRARLLVAFLLAKSGNEAAVLRWKLHCELRALAATMGVDARHALCKDAEALAWLAGDREYDLDEGQRERLEYLRGYLLPAPR